MTARKGRKKRLELFYAKPVSNRRGWYPAGFALPIPVKGKKEMRNVKYVWHKNQILLLMTYQQSKGRNAMFLLHSSLSMLVLCILNIEANRFYDRNHLMYDAALLTRYYTQHALQSFSDSEINHQRHFIKNPFINIGMVFGGVPSTFQDKCVLSSLPDCFQNSELPILC